jgi:hypothetical protein
MDLTNIVDRISDGDLSREEIREACVELEMKGQDEMRELAAKVVCVFCADGVPVSCLGELGWVHGKNLPVEWEHGCDAEEIRDIKSPHEVVG